MTDEALLEFVKNSNMITGNYLDNMLRAKISEVKNFLISSGVSSDVVNSDISSGVIAIGVNDLYSTQGTGGTQKFSSYFIQRAIQLQYTVLPESEGEEIE